VKVFPFLAASVLVWQGLLPAASHAQSQLNYTTSWIGNTFGFGDGKWVQHDVEAISVAPDGTVYTNAPWDEAGSEIAAYRNGDKLAVAGQTHGWGNTGGDAIATNGTYLYAAMSIGNGNNGLVGADFPPSGQTWFGITRRPIANIATGVPFAGGIGNRANATKNSFLLMNSVATGTDAGIRGLAATPTELYVADTYGNQIVVFDATTMQRLRSWSVASPGRIAIDTDSTLWVIQGLQASGSMSVAHFSANGALLSGAITLPATAIPTDIAVAPNGQIVVADNGPSQQILAFNKLASGQTQQAASIGTQSGMSHATKGAAGTMRFNGVTGIGFDKSNNLYVAQNHFGPRPFGSGYTGDGAVIESYVFGTRWLDWRLYGLTFVDTGTFDPASPNEVYTGSKHFTLDYSRPAGQEWSYKAFTMNRFDYPDDPALHLPRNVRGSPMMRRINGNLYLYALDFNAHYLSVYRFNPGTQGEIAIPSGLLAQNPIRGTWPAGQPTYGEWMWRDTNGDGHVDASEITGNPSTGSTVGNGFYWVDTVGNVWQATPGSGIREMPLQGFDPVGNPIYQYATSKMFPMPQPFNRIARIVYIAETDTMYISGFTAAVPWDSTHWKEAGPVLARYDNWSTGTPTMQYAISLPWSTQTSPQVTPVGVAVAGNTIFVAELYTPKVDVYDARTGQPVGYMTPGANVGNTSGWVDVYLGISATQRPNGEYVVLVEDDARAKVLMYRWTP
jgi:hypothetical protein